MIMNQGYTSSSIEYFLQPIQVQAPIKADAHERVFLRVPAMRKQL